MIIVCGGIKGGTGKSTIGTNITVMRAADKDVLLVDADEQQSATLFTALRKTNHPDKPQYTSIILQDDQVRREIERMHKKFDDVIIDTGGRDTRSQRAALSLADLLLIPFNPRSLDIWTIENVETLLTDIRSINPGLRVVSFLNRADPVGIDNEESQMILSEVGGFESPNIAIVNRKVFGKAISQGLSVPEVRPKDSKAQQEIVALYQYIFGA